MEPEPKNPSDRHDPADAREADAADVASADEVAVAVEKGADRTEQKAASRGATASDGWWRRCLTIRDQPSGLERILFGALGVLAVLLVWYILTMGPPANRIVKQYALPSLGETVKSFPSLWMDRALARSAVWSLGRVLGGFAIAAAIAVPLGVLAGCYFRVQAFFNPLNIFGRNVPIAALIPLTMMWFGIGEPQKVMFITLASAAFIFFDTTNSLHGVSNRFLDTAYCLGARFVGRTKLLAALIVALVYAVVGLLVTGGPGAMQAVAAETGSAVGALLEGGWLGFVCGGLLGFALWFPILGHQAISKVLLPLALPGIVNSLRLLFGLAFGYIMLAEVVNAGHGLGHLIITSQRQGPREHVFLCLIFIALLAFAIDRTVFTIQKMCFPYKYSGNG